MHLNFLTNPDPNRQEKVRFFADYFLFVNEFLGKLPDIPFDNPYSILDKILFQIEKNPNKFPIYIGNYFQQLFSFYNSKEGEDQIAIIKKLYKKYDLQGSKNRKKWVNDNPDFILEIKNLHSEYKANLFNKNFSSLFSYLNCPHTLKEHENEIKFCVQILVSQFRLNGYSKQHVDTSIDRILSRDTNFPFPPEIANIKDTLEQKKAQDEYLAKRDFKEQFSGLKYLLTRVNFQKGIFIYSIENCFLDSEIKGSFKVQFDQVTFISPSHDALKALKKSVLENQNTLSKKIQKIFFEENILLAYVTMNYDSLKFAKLTGLNKVEKELHQLNNYINKDLRINAKHYLFTKDLEKIGEVGIGPMDDVITIRKNDLQIIEVNPYETLRNISSEAKDQILFTEEVFFRSINKDNVAFYWHYVENIFSAINITDASKIQRDFSTLLFRQIDKLKKEFLMQINSLIFPFFGFDYASIGLEEDDIFIPAGGALKKMDPNFNLIKFHKKITNPFIKYVISYYKEFDSTKRNEIWNEYFKSLMLELYEYRNSKLHTGVVNSFSEIKLQEVLPLIINKVRWEFIFSCKANPTFSFKEIIDLLKK